MPWRCLHTAMARLRASSGGNASLQLRAPPSRRLGSMGGRTAESASSSQAWVAGALAAGTLAGCAATGFCQSQQHPVPPKEQGASPDVLEQAHPFRRTLYIMRGVPGSGKSTVAHGILRRHLAANGVHGHLDEIAPLSRGFILSTDDFFTHVDEQTGVESTVFDMKQIKRHHERNHIRCDIAMELGISPIIVDNTNTRAWEMREYVQLAKSHGYRILIKDVMEIQQIDLDVIRERLTKRRSATGKDVPFAAVEQMLKRYEKLPADPDDAVAFILEAKSPYQQAATQQQQLLEARQPDS